MQSARRSKRGCAHRAVSARVDEWVNRGMELFSESRKVEAELGESLATSKRLHSLMLSALERMEPGESGEDWKLS